MKGSLQKRGLNSWRLKYDLEPDATGQRQTRYVTLKGVRREAEAQAAKILGAVVSGDHVDPSGETVAQFVERCRLRSGPS
jgi:integrase